MVKESVLRYYLNARDTFERVYFLLSPPTADLHRFSNRNYVTSLRQNGKSRRNVTAPLCGFFWFEDKMSVYHDEVEIEDFELDEDTDTFYFPCPCGDRFAITRVSASC